MIIIDKAVLKDINSGFSIPAQPKLLLDLLRLMTKPQPDINAIADVISKDIAISAIVLKTINSPLYGLGRTVTDIKMSVNYIGFRGIVMLVTSCLIQKSFKQKNCCIVLEHFWQTTNAVANTCVLLGKKFKPALTTDKLFSLGLFHDCGMPIMAMKFNDYQQVIEQSATHQNKALKELEDQKYHVNHAVIGYYVASSWHLPKDICQIILQHGDRDFLTVLDGSEQQSYFAILKLAEHIVSLENGTLASTDWPYLKEEVFSILAMNDEVLENFIAELVE